MLADRPKRLTEAANGGNTVAQYAVYMEERVKALEKVEPDPDEPDKLGVGRPVELDKWAEKGNALAQYAQALEQSNADLRYDMVCWKRRLRCLLD